MRSMVVKLLKIYKLAIIASIKGILPNKCVAVGRNTLFNSFFQAKIIVLNRFCGNPKSETSKMVVKNYKNLISKKFLSFQVVPLVKDLAP
jgi:hypothetical protein